MLTNLAGAHINMYHMYPPEKPAAEPTAEEKKSLQRSMDFALGGMGYAMIHATRPSTIGLVVGSSPIALLAWYVAPLLCRNAISAH